MNAYQSDSDAVWVGIWSATVGHYLNHPDDSETLRQTYRDFLKSPIGAGMNLPPLPPRGRVTPFARPRALLGAKH